MLLIYLIILVIVSSQQNKHDSINIKSINRLGIIGILGILILNIEGLSDATILGGFNDSIYGGYLQISVGQIITNNLVLFLALISFIVVSIDITGINKVDSVNYKNKDYVIIILFNVFAVLSYSVVNDIMAMYILIELQSFSLYVLLASNNDKYRYVESGLMYFLIGGLGSIMILLGTGVIYYGSDETNWTINTMLNEGNISGNITLASAIYLIGIYLKTGGSPTHNWSIAVYENTPTVTTMWVSVISKISLLSDYGLIVGIDNNSEYWGIAITLGVLTGCLGGLSQIKIKILLVYSGVLNIAFLVISLLIGGQEGEISYLVYLVQYTISHINIFLCILVAGYYQLEVGTKVEDNRGWVVTREDSPVEYLTQLKGLMWINPYLGMAMVITLYSFIGIPPLMGFYGKYIILRELIGSSAYYYVILIILGSSISAVFYGYSIKTIAFLNPNKILTRERQSNTISSSISYIISSLTMIILLGFVELERIISGISMMIITGINDIS